MINKEEKSQLCSIKMSSFNILQSMTRCSHNLICHLKIQLYSGCTDFANTVNKYWWNFIRPKMQAEPQSTGFFPLRGEDRAASVYV